MGQKNSFEGMPYTGKLRAPSVLLFSKRDYLFTVQKGLNVSKILVSRSLSNLAEKDKIWLR